jgi:FKBP-type peptidyl-prolyl cis-trans isomerase 2
MTKASKGDVVKVEYSLTLSDGTLVEETHKGKPLTFTVGAGQVLPGFDAAVVGMEVGEDKSVDLKAEDAFGKRRDSLVKSIPRQLVPRGHMPSVGDVLMTETPSGKLSAREVSVDDKFVVLDANPKFAGQDVAFRIKLLEIVDTIKVVRRRKKKDAG